MSVFTEIPVEIHAFGLTPGTQYCASFAFTADDGGGGFNLGCNQQPVAKNGTISFAQDWTDVSPKGEAGTVLIWIRKGAANGGQFDDPPENDGAGQPMKAEVHVP